MKGFPALVTLCFRIPPLPTPSLISGKQDGASLALLAVVEQLLDPKSQPIKNYGHCLLKGSVSEYTNHKLHTDPDAGKIEGKRRRGLREDEMVVWHHQLDGREFEQTPGDGDGQGSLVCCSPWGRKESDMTE